jgi:hypothetical protein
VGALIANALARVQAFLLEPAEESLGVRPATSLPVRFAPASPITDLRVVVLGLTPRCGSSTVARGLAVALGRVRGRVPQLIAVQAEQSQASALVGRPFAGGLRWEAPRSLSGVELVEYGRTVGALAGGPSALVWDVASGETERATSAAAGADAVVLVAPGTSEPALADLVARMLGERHGRVLLVAARVSDPAPWGERATCLPDSRLGAALVTRGRRATGELGLAFDGLAAILESGG